VKTPCGYKREKGGERSVGRKSERKRKNEKKEPRHPIKKKTGYLGGDNKDLGGEKWILNKQEFSKA